MSDTPDISALPEHGHDPVLPAETLQYLDPQPGQTIVDCTLGRGGHSSLIAKRLDPGGHLIALDADPRNLEYARGRLGEAGAGGDGGCRVDLVHSNFARLTDVLAELDVMAVDGILADLGVSTNQLLDPQYGLSFGPKDQPAEAALDMRLNPETALTAGEIVNRWDEKRLADVLYFLAQERYSRRIARKVIERRRLRPIETVGELAELVRHAVPWPKGPRGRRGPRDKPAIDPATRTFMALRMAVNRELDVLQQLLHDAPRTLRPGGRFVVISFHSGEDRLVKQAFRDASGLGELEVLTKKPVTPGEDELARNPRSRSAKLRAATRTDRTT